MSAWIASSLWETRGGGGGLLFLSEGLGFGNDGVGVRILSREKPVGQQNNQQICERVFQATESCAKPYLGPWLRKCKAFNWILGNYNLM